MEKTYKENINMWSITTDSAHILHRVGSDDYPEIRRAMIRESYLADWEEISVSDIPPYTTAEYNAKVAELIHHRYDTDKEMSLINNMMEAEPTEAHKAEYTAYQAYRAECKQKAKDPSLYVREDAASAPDDDLTEQDSDNPAI